MGKLVPCSKKCFADTRDRASKINVILLAARLCCTHETVAVPFYICLAVRLNALSCNTTVWNAVWQ